MDDILNKWKKGLERTRKVTFGRLANMFGATEITEDTWEELEEIFLQADMGLETSLSILEDLNQKVHLEGLTKTDQLQAEIESELLSRLAVPPEFSIDEHSPAVILLVGVNGSGKTTSAAKLGKRFQDMQKKVMFGAADTFRAAAVEQLQVWGQRLNIPVIAGQPNADPGAVTYDTIQSAISRKMDVVIIDTAGRLHTRYNLMEELKKVYRVAGKSLPGAPHETWLVMDATTGQNALQQAIIFKEAVNITGIILTKLDSSSRGGMTFAIQQELGLPILFAGMGESPEDFRVFNPDVFVKSLLSKN
ncbi:MAG: signal recognition particle-docking protein FtsY [Bacteroidales bacterium]|nr:signal recognition particle-docking protein FtsY [Bacteroidales bacterium]